MAETAGATTLSRGESSGGRILAGLRNDTDSGSGVGPSDSKSGKIKVIEVNGRKYSFRTAEYTASKNTLDRQGRRKPIEGETRAFTEETLGEIVDDVKTELDNLAEMQSGDQEDQAAFQRFINHTAFQLHKDFFDKFTAPKPGSGEGTPTREVDVDKLTKWLATDRGLQDAYSFAVMRSEIIALNSGVLADMDKRIKNIPQPGGIGNTDVSTREGLRLRELARKAKLWGQEDNVDTTGRKTPILGIKKKGTIGAIVGGLTIAGAFTPAGPLGVVLPPVAAGIIRSFRKGGSVNIEASKEALQIAKTDDPVMQDWARRTQGLDVRNLTIRNGRLARDKVVIDPYLVRQGIVNPSMDSETALGKLVEEDRKILAMQEEMGVPERLRAGMDNQFLRRGHEQDLQRGIVSEEDVLTALKQDPRMVDHNGNPCMVNIAVPGAVPRWLDNDPAFFAAYGAILAARVPPVILHGPFERDTMTPDENIAAWRLKREIRVRLAHERHVLNWDKLLESKHDRLPNLRDKIDKAKEAEGDGSKNTVKINERLRLLGVDAELLPAIAGPFETLEASLEVLNKATQVSLEAQEKAKKVVSELVGTVTQAGVVIDANNVRSIIEKLRKDKASAPLQFGDREIASIASQQEALDTEINTRIEETWAKEPGNAVPKELYGAPPLPFDVIKPTRPDEPTALAGGATDQEKADYKDRKNAYELKIRAYDRELEVYDHERAAHDKKVADYKQEQQQHQARLEAYSARREAAKAALRATPEFTEKQADINNDKQALEDFLTELTKANAAIETAKTEGDAAIETARNDLIKTGSENTIRTETNRAASEMRNALAIVEGWTRVGPVLPPLAPVDLTRGILETEDSVEELFRRINEANKHDPRVGWPEAANNETANRELLLRAMVEARIEPVTNAYVQAFDQNYWGLTEYDLLLMPLESIKAIMTQKRDRLGLVDIPEDDDINALKELAQERFTQRREAFEELKSENEIRQRELTNEKASITAEGGKSPELATIDRAVGRYADIRTVVTGMNQQQLVTALDSHRAADVDPNATRFLPSELEDNHSVAFDEIQQMIFDNRNHDQDGVTFRGETGRDAAVRRNAELVSEEVLRDQLVFWFRLPVFMPGAPAAGGAPATTTVLGTFEQHIERIRNEVAAGEITPEDFAEFLTESVIFDFMAPRLDRL